MLRICALFVAALLVLPLWAAQPEFSGEARVIDADTIEVAGQRIRLGGIDAPEMQETCTDAQGRQWPCGRWATDTARAMVAGARLRCVDLGERTYERVVGRCYLRGRDLGEYLIEAGAARPCLRFARAQGTDRAYLTAERVAKAARAGVYGGPLNPVAGFCEVRNVPAPIPAGAIQPDAACVIKGNVSNNGRIYHMPGQRDYGRVTMRGAETRWFCSEAEAKAAGWRRALR